MRNSNSPPSWQPREGGGPPPGGAEEFARYRQMQAMPAKQRNFMQMAQGIIGQMPQRQQPQRPTQPDWSQSNAVQWPGRGGPPQGAPPMPPQGQMPGPSAQPPSGMSMMPNTNVPPPQRPPAQPPANRFQPAGAAGIGQAARGMYDRARVNALRGGGGKMQEQ